MEFSVLFIIIAAAVATTVPLVIATELTNVEQSTPSSDREPLKKVFLFLNKQ